MREIRFRAYFEVETQDENTNPIIYGTTWEVRRLDFSYSYVELYDPKTGLETEASFDEIKLMQYTGLKDKNGKEIYEGDIVKFRIKNLIVGFDTAYSGYYFLENDATAGFLMYGPFYQRNSSECEVIGNIYENPELLEESI